MLFPGESQHVSIEFHFCALTLVVG